VSTPVDRLPLAFGAVLQLGCRQPAHRAGSHRPAAPAQARLRRGQNSSRPVADGNWSAILVSDFDILKLLDKYWTRWGVILQNLPNSAKAEAPFYWGFASKVAERMGFEVRSS